MAILYLKLILFAILHILSRLLLLLRRCQEASGGLLVGLARLSASRILLCVFMTFAMAVTVTVAMAMLSLDVCAGSRIRLHLLRLFLGDESFLLVGVELIDDTAAILQSLLVADKPRWPLRHVVGQLLLTACMMGGKDWVGVLELRYRFLTKDVLDVSLLFHLINQILPHFHQLRLLLPHFGRHCAHGLLSGVHQALRRSVLLFVPALPVTIHVLDGCHELAESIHKRIA